MRLRVAEVTSILWRVRCPAIKLISHALLIVEERPEAPGKLESISTPYPAWRSAAYFQPARLLGSDRE
jgi:hypothetical protein